MYQFIDKLQALYGLLQDDLSREIFQSRLAIDVDWSVPNIKRLVSLGSMKEWIQPQKEVLKKLSQENKKIILYGAGFVGQTIIFLLLLEQIDVYGFCGRDAEQFPDGLWGKPVLSPDELLAHGDEYYVVPTLLTEKTYKEVYEFLRKNNYPEERILGWIDISGIYDVENQYFEFPALYRRGTAFIDAGCLDCETSYRFAEWCEGEYSSIIAFEPDPNNYAYCCARTQDNPLPNLQVVNAGVSSREGTAVFAAQHSAGSRIVPNGVDIMGDKISIHTVAIDDIVGDRTVGFIKMDIEGGEFDALHGAKNTIVRDKPLLAISVYHLRGDLFAIMDYLHQLLPEYRFWLRHYSAYASETVLYASVDWGRLSEDL